MTRVPTIEDVAWLMPFYAGDALAELAVEQSSLVTAMLIAGVDVGDPSFRVELETLRFVSTEFSRHVHEHGERADVQADAERLVAAIGAKRATRPDDSPAE